MRHVLFSPPDITEAEISEVVDALKSGWITTGPKTKKLEQLVAERCHTSKAVCLNSNTACAEITLRILGIGIGDEVIVPAYTYTATASVVEHVGARLVMIDCEHGKFTMDYEKLTAEGGAVVWRDIEGIDNDELYHQYMLLSLHGQSKDALAKTKLGAWEYDIIGPWYKCNMTDVCAGIGLGQIKRYDEILSRRKEIIDRYNKGLKGLPITVVTHYTSDIVSSGHLYIINLNDKDAEQRNKFIEEMAGLGVATNVHYKPLPMHTGYKKLGFKIEDYPNAYKQFKNVVTLPLHTCLSDEDVDYVIECVKECLK